MMALSLRGVTKTFRRNGESVRALHEVSLEVRPGEAVALTGPSGSGKTTLLNCIAGFDRPDAGAVEIGGLDIADLPDAELDAVRTRTIGFIFQQFNLIPALSALDNVALALARAPLPRAEKRARAARQLERLGLAPHMARRPAALSGGQQQRVAVARALVGDPRLLLADEPTAALDRVSATVLLDLMLERARDQGAAVIISTHDPRCIDRVGRTVTLCDGEIAS